MGVASAGLLTLGSSFHSLTHCTPELSNQGVPKVPGLQQVSVHAPAPDLGRNPGQEVAAEVPTDAHVQHPRTAWEHPQVGPQRALQMGWHWHWPRSPEALASLVPGGQVSKDSGFLQGHKEGTNPGGKGEPGLVAGGHPGLLWPTVL